MVKRGLGRGLQALIPEIEEEMSNSIEIKIKDIHPNQHQPRKEFDSVKLEELSSSIREHGLIQPIIVSPLKKGYQIVAGERRWRAASMIGLESIPAIIKDFTEQEIMEIAMIENLQREDLNSIEEANAYRQLIEQYSLTQDLIAQRIGKSRPFIANSLRLLNLSKDIQDLISQNQLSAGHGRALLAVEDHRKRDLLAKKLVEDKISVRELEKIVKDLKINNTKTKKEIVKSPFLIELEDNLRNILGTKVSISSKNKRGKIEIEYYSNEDLERILELITSK